jgi:hypothetical protein
VFSASRGVNQESPVGNEGRFSPWHSVWKECERTSRITNPEDFRSFGAGRKNSRSKFEKKKKKSGNEQCARPEQPNRRAGSRSELEKKNIVCSEPKRDDVARDTQTAARLTAARPRPRRSHGVVVAHVREPERALDHRRSRRATRATAPCSPSRVAPRGARWGWRARRWSRAW